MKLKDYTFSTYIKRVKKTIPGQFINRPADKNRIDDKGKTGGFDKAQKNQYPNRTTREAKDAEELFPLSLPDESASKFSPTNSYFQGMNMEVGRSLLNIKPVSNLEQSGTVSGVLVYDGVKGPGFYGATGSYSQTGSSKNAQEVPKELERLNNGVNHFNNVKLKLGDAIRIGLYKQIFVYLGDIKGTGLHYADAGFNYTQLSIPQKSNFDDDAIRNFMANLYKQIYKKAKEDGNIEAMDMLVNQARSKQIEFKGE